MTHPDLPGVSGELAARLSPEDWQRILASDAWWWHVAIIDPDGPITDFESEYARCVALTDTDIAGNLPSFLAETKRGDPRYTWFVQHHGTECWELDAMSPVDLRERVANAIFANIDIVPWQRAEVVEQAERESFICVMGEWRRSV